MIPEYSPICATDRECYLAYLRVFNQYGQLVEFFGGERGRAQDSGLDGRGYYVERSAAGSSGVRIPEGARELARDVLRDVISSGEFGIVSSGDGTTFGSCQTVGRLAVGDDPGESSGSCDRDIDESGARCSDDDAQDRDESVEETVKPSGFVFVENQCRGSGETKTERNRRWRHERRDRKRNRKHIDDDWRKRTKTPDEGYGSASDVDGALRASLERKWKAQNELAVAKAERDLELLRAVDVSEEVKKKKTSLALQVEKNMVGMEKAHSSLRSTGNVIDDGDARGFAETVVSGEGGFGESISPNSSASMGEFRALHKALLDSEAKNVELERKLNKISQKLGKDCHFVDYFDKRTWTDTSENREILNEVYPDGYGELTEYCEEGKFQVVEC